MSLFFYSLVFGFLGAFTVMKYGRQTGIIDILSSRSSHSKIIPKDGGIGMLLAFVLSGLILELPVNFWVPSFFISLVSL